MYISYILRLKNYHNFTLEYSELSYKFWTFVAAILWWTGNICNIYDSH